MTWVRWRSSAHVAEQIPMVSSHGRVKTMQGIIHSGTASPDGYRYSGIGGRTLGVHRLVARAFLGHPPTVNHCQVHHRDGVKCNNHVSNLEYVTPSQNMLYFHQVSVNPSRYQFNSRPVLGRQCGSHVWDKFPSMAEAARTLGLPKEGVRGCCHGKQPRTSNYEFRFAEISDVVIPGEEWATALHPETGSALSPLDVSSHGRVKSPRRMAHYGSKTAAGYRSTSVFLNGRKLSFLVHRLVARTFIGVKPTPQMCEVNHKDADKANNHVENLEYISRAENIRRRGVTVRSCSMPVLWRPVGMSEWAQFRSTSEAARVLRIGQSSVKRCCEGKAPHACGYEFKHAAPQYIEGEEWREMLFDL